MEAIIFTGIQASGKSTFLKERFFNTHVRINLDMLKTRNRESILLDACLKSLQPFVIDNTNLTKEDRTRYLAPAKAAGFKIIGYYFRSSVDECDERNAQRQGKAKIPERGIRGASARLEIPSMDEGFDALFYVWIDGERFIVEEWQDEV